MNVGLNYISSNEVDKIKWDKCIQDSLNGIVFGYSWCLDSVCDSWDALILNDYEAVFPIIRSSKLGIHYFFNPIFALQLGVFSKNEISEEVLSEFLKAIPTKIKLIDIQLNFGNKINNTDFQVSTKSCQKIDLSQDYTSISSKYSTNLKRNLSKARKNKLEIVLSTDSEQVIRLFKENRGDALTEIKSEHYVRLKSLLDKMIEKEVSKIYECWKDGLLIASAAFSITNNRIIYIKGGTTSEGRKLGAMHLIMDEVLRLNSEKDLNFDFGGSSIPQVARFNHGFGSEDYFYNRLYLNRLPFWLKMLKK